MRTDDILENAIGNALFDRNKRICPDGYSNFLSKSTVVTKVVKLGKRRLEWKHRINLQELPTLEWNIA